MKISKLFHWLYTSLMLLPFASVVSTTLYYSFNKNAVIPQVDKEVSKEVDFNQLYKGNGSTATLSGGTATFVNNEIDIVVDTNVSSDLYFPVPLGIIFNNEHLYYLKSNSNSNYQLYTYINSVYTPVTNNTLITLNKGGTIGSFLVNTNTVGSYTIKLNVFDITQMFGVGNEINTSDFDNFYSDYYDYTLSEHIVIPNFETIQVADNSINHFWLPCFGAIGYNIQSYIGWVIGGIFGLNVVNGIGFVIVRLFTYWLIISICWLIFDVLMYVPNLVHKWLDKAAID